ncbi:hypothetical protein [Thiobacillus sp.]|uniref:hypothetical protein n=1 Tax=Thiobacillus sp. TaxID=924 RepID=UPI0025E07D5C|nr:hypothetical protein [Thiobacillus sp.]
MLQRLGATFEILLPYSRLVYPPDLDVLWQGVADKTKPDAAKIHFIRRQPR